MTAKHGGRREGAGRKPKAPAVLTGCTAEEYLERVVQGLEKPDALRVAAARSLLRFQSPIRRLPERAPSSKDLARKNEIADDAASRSAFEQRAREIREKHAKKQ